MAKNKTTAPKNYSYFDKYLQRQVQLRPKTDEVVVAVEPKLTERSRAVNESVITETSRKNSLQGVAKANYTRGVAVLKAASDAPERGTGLEFLAPPGDELMNSIPAFVDADGATRYFMPDEITVQFKKNISDEAANQIIKQLGSSVIVKQRTKGYYTIAVPAGSNVFEAIDTFNQLDSVKFAEASEIGFDDAQAAPNDLRFGELWGLHNTGQVVEGLSGTPGADIGVLEAWETTRGSNRVAIVVIDTGMDGAHEDLVNNALPRGSEDWDFEAADGSPDDSEDHGTHVCGTAAASAGNARGITGVAPECRLMPLRVNLQAGMNANRADAINFAAEKAAANAGNRYIVNCSWICSGSFSAILAAIDNAIEKGALVVVSAGNAARDMDQGPPQHPGVHPNAICVAALTCQDTRAVFSNIGSQVDVSAPGQGILSCKPGGGYQFKNGTSMAAPHVAGTLALIWSANLSLTNREVRQILESTCEQITGAGPELTGKLGRGRINAAKAVAAARAVPVMITA